ncbi:MAG: putative ABC transporter permease [Acutalibacteraceae bacterium]|nr:putative ABC transporter permease [Acutalibacteraceae bacterium]
MKYKEKTYRKIMTIFLLFFICCFLGWVYELIFYRIDTGEFIKRGQGFGPWLPIYGFGAMLILLITRRQKFSMLSVFLISALSSGVLELVVGWALFTFGNGLRLWDYNTEIWNFGNIGGYVCFRSILVFALMGTGLCYIIEPKVSSFTEKLKFKTLTAITIPVAVIFLSDLTFGYLIKLALSAF